jgi:hypothetical protein
LPPLLPPLHAPASRRAEMARMTDVRRMRRNVPDRAVACAGWPPSSAPRP